MRTKSLDHLHDSFHNKKEHYPWSGQIELTLRCNLNCVHCYCKGLHTGSQGHPTALKLRRAGKDTKSHVSDKRELTTKEWKRILDEIQKEGCLHLTITGGEPLLRPDFLEIYAYAKEKGFLITVFTNGHLFTKKIIDYFRKCPPFSIEITLNGITEAVYEKITQIEGSFSRILPILKGLADQKLPLILKANCLRQNKDEIAKIKAFVADLLGESNRGWRFKYDPFVFPGLSGGRTPCDYRLSFEELVELRKQDENIWMEYKRSLCADLPDLGREKSFLYRCTSWFNQFFINPYGELKFCELSDKFSVNLTKTSFREGFYNVFPQILNEKFKTDSKCRECSLRPICYHCPARAYLETGDEEAPVQYFCDMAKSTLALHDSYSTVSEPSSRGSKI